MHHMVIVEGLPDGWAIHQERYGVNGDFRLEKDDVWIAAGVKHSRANEDGWVITTIAHESIRPVVDGIMREFREYMNRKHDYEVMIAQRNIEARQKKRADDAIAAVFGSAGDDPLDCDHLGLASAGAPRQLARHGLPRGGIVCGCSEGLSAWTEAAIRARAAEIENGKSDE